MTDLEARKHIIRDIHTNLFVEAGAGSGKTTMLVERMVAMVEEGLPVEKICTITFTKAAANEFYERFQRRLIERSSIPSEYKEEEYRLPKPTEETAKRCQEALQNIDLCFMGTIDSFCNMVLSEHPAKAKIPSSAKIISEEEMEEVFLREYSEIQRGNYSEELQNLCLKFSSTRNNAASVFVALMKKLYETRDADFIFTEPAEETLDEIFSDRIHSLREIIKTLKKNPEIAAERDKSKEVDAAWEVLLQDKTSRYIDETWEGNLQSVSKVIKDIRKIRILPVKDIEEYFGAQFYLIKPHNDKCKYYEFNEEFIDNLTEDLKNYQSQIALKFVTECLKEIPDKLRKQGELSFFDYKLYLRDMLKEDASGSGKLIDHIYKRHSYFLIDEFQDTDPMQAQIFFYLAARNPDKDWKKCVPREGSLFIVGDPKQSIYRFKNADVASFQTVKALFNTDTSKTVQLTSNFRSTTVLHKWFNGVFTRLLDEDTVDQNRFEEIPIDETRNDSFITGIYTYEADMSRKPVPENTDDSMVLEIINRLVNNPNILIPDENLSEEEKKNKVVKGRMIDYRDIMIITKTKPALQKYTRIFTENSIPFRIEGVINFNESPSLLELIKLFNYVTEPTNNMYLYALLNSPLFNNGTLDISEYYEVLKDSIVDKNVIPSVLLEMIEDAEYLSPSALFSSLIERSRIFAISGSLNLEYVYYVLELLRTAEETKEICSHKQAREYLNKLLDGTLKLERCTSLEKSTNRIHLANLHKVKGLEANVVILANPDGRARKPEKRVEYNEEKPKCYVFEVSDNFIPILKLNENKDKYDLETASSEAEDIRLLYVAATRAKRLLISSKSSAKNQPWGLLNQYIKDDFFDSFKEANPSEQRSLTFVEAEPLYAKSESTIVINKESQQAVAEPVIRIKKPSNIDNEIDYKEAARSENTDGRKYDPTLLGTMVHRLIELIILSNGKLDVYNAVDNITANIDHEDDCYELFFDIAKALMEEGGYTQQNGAPKDILKDVLSAEEVYCELPFSYKEDNNTICSGIIDLLYKKDGKYHIIDWKTNKSDERLAEHYKSQLDTYIKATKQLIGEDVEDALIYHLEV